MGWLDIWRCTNVECPFVDYGKEGEPCPLCRTELENIKSDFWSEIESVKESKFPQAKNRGWTNPPRCKNVECPFVDSGKVGEPCPECGTTLENIGGKFWSEVEAAKISKFPQAKKSGFWNNFICDDPYCQNTDTKNKGGYCAQCGSELTEAGIEEESKYLT